MGYFLFLSSLKFGWVRVHTIITNLVHRLKRSIRNGVQIHSNHIKGEGGTGTVRVHDSMTGEGKAGGSLGIAGCQSG